MTTIKIELCSYSPLDLSSLNKKHDIKLHGAFVLSATEFIENDDIPPFCVPQTHQEITLSCDYLEILNENDDNNKKEKKLKEQKSKRAKER